MHVLEVGQPYNPGRTRWPETPHLRLTPGGCELVLFLGHPSAAEVRDVRTGIAQFTWTDGGPVSVLCFRFGTLPWMDTPHEPWRETEADRGTPAGAPGNQLALQVVLADASTGLVKALRLLTWDPEFAEAVRQTVRRQLTCPRNDAAAARRLNALYAQDSATLAMNATVRCTGGQPGAAGDSGPEAVIGRHIAAIVPGKGYPRPLPADLAPWHVYTADGGHSIAVALAAFYQPGGDPAEFLVPAPVKAVLKAGWTARDGWIVCDLPYDPAVGLATDPGDDEY